MGHLFFWWLAGPVHRRPPATPACRRPASAPTSSRSSAPSTRCATSHPRGAPGGGSAPPAEMVANVQIRSVEVHKPWISISACPTGPGGGGDGGGGSPTGSARNGAAFLSLNFCGGLGQSSLVLCHFGRAGQSHPPPPRAGGEGAASG